MLPFSHVAEAKSHTCHKLPKKIELVQAIVAQSMFFLLLILQGKISLDEARRKTWLFDTEVNADFISSFTGSSCALNTFFSVAGLLSLAITGVISCWCICLGRD